MTWEPVLFKPSDELLDSPLLPPLLFHVCADVLCTILQLWILHRKPSALLKTPANITNIGLDLLGCMGWIFLSAPFACRNTIFTPTSRLWNCELVCENSNTSHLKCLFFSFKLIMFTVDDTIQLIKQHYLVINQMLFKFCILCYMDCTPLLHSATLVLGVGGSLGQTESSIMGREECGRAQVLWILESGLQCGGIKACLGKYSSHRISLNRRLLLG